MYSKEQQAVLTYVQQAVYSSNKQCSKQYAAVAASSVASSSNSEQCSKQQQQQQQQHKQPYSYLQQTPAPQNNYYCCTRVQFRSSSSSTLSILPCTWYSVRQAAADKASSCKTTTAVAVCRFKVCIIWCVPGTCTSVRAHTQQYKSLPVYPLHAATLL